MASKLTPKKYRAIESLLIDGSVTNAAKTANVSRQTVYDWLRDPTFAAELRRSEGLALQGLGRRLLALGELAGDALKDALQPSQPINTRVRAAQIVAERGPALAELSAVVARLEAMETRMSVDVSTLTDSQLERIVRGEDPATVVASSNGR